MGIACVRLKNLEFFAIVLDGLHTAKTEGAEVGVERVEGVALLIREDLGGNEFRGDFLGKESG